MGITNMEFYLLVDAAEQRERERDPSGDVDWTNNNITIISISY